MSNQRSILPTFDVFSAPGVQAVPGMPTQAAAGSGSLGGARLFALSPVFAAVKGLGDAEGLSRCVSACNEAEKPMTAGAVATAAVVLGIVGALSYQAGKAIAPSRQDASTWGWIGVPVGLFTGVLGLGVMGVVSNQKKG